MDKGPTRWPVCVFYDAPTVVSKPVPWQQVEEAQLGSSKGMEKGQVSNVAQMASDCKASSGGVVTGCLDQDGPGMPTASTSAVDKSAVYAIDTDPKQLIVLKGRAGQRQLRVLLDCGSHRTWIAEQLCEGIGCRTVPSKDSIHARLVNGTMEVVDSMVPSFKL